jgi:hypothetical protein
MAIEEWQSVKWLANQIKDEPISKMEGIFEPGQIPVIFDHTPPTQKAPFPQ